MKYMRRFDDGDKVWVEVNNDPRIVMYVKGGECDGGNEYWKYQVQEKDSAGRWTGPVRWRKEKALTRA